MSDERGDHQPSVRTADPGAPVELAESSYEQAESSYEQAESSYEQAESSYEEALAAVDELRLELQRRELQRRRRPREPVARKPTPAGDDAEAAVRTPEDVSSHQEPEPSTKSQETRAGWAVAAIAGVVAAIAAATVVGVVYEAPRELSEPDATSGGADNPLTAPDVRTADVGAAPEGRQQEPENGAPASELQLSELFFNERAGYGFRYPEEWSLRRAGEVARVVSPDGTRVVSFALGPTGSDSLESFASLLERSYDDVRIIARDRTLLGGDDAVAMRGSATNSAGDDLLFEALVLQRPGQRAVGAFAASRSRPTLGAVAATIMRSLQLEH